MKTIDEKYKYDLSYQEMVNAMIDTLEDGDLTSTDLIEATVYAIRRFEEQEMKPVRHLSQVVSQGAKSPDNPKEILTEKQKTVFEYLQTCPKGITSIKNISLELSYPYESVRKHIRALHEEGLISKPQIYRHRNFKGIQFEVLV